MGKAISYDAAEQSDILQDTVQSASIVNGNLVVTRHSGAQQTLGPAKGPQGPTGYAGSGLSDLQDDFAPVTPGLWNSISYDTNLWEPYGFGYPDLRYRITGNYVELNGLLRYIGTSGINLAPSLMTTNDNLDLCPNDGYWRFIQVLRNGRYVQQVIFANFGGTTMYGVLAGGGSHPAWNSGDWCAFGPGSCWHNVVI